MASQTLPFVQGDCLYLDDLTPCGPAYRGYPVSALLWKEQSDFNAMINALNAPSTDTFTDNSRYGCSAGAQLTDAFGSLRYQMSYVCAVAVFDAIQNYKCPVPSNGGFSSYGPLICQEQCNFATQSFTDLVLNQQLCPNSNSSYVNIGLMARNQRCASMSEAAGQVNNQCQISVGVDTHTCGFLSATAAKNYCADGSAGKSDSCCKAVLGSSNGSSMGIIIGVVVCLIVVTLALVAFFYLRSRRRVTEKTESYDMRSQFANNPYGPAGTNNSKQPSDMVYQQTAPIVAASLPPSPPSSTAGVGGTLMRVIHPYDAALQDELSLVVGSDILVMKEFDDGWAQGMNPKTGVQGAFPMICVAKPDAASAAAKQSKLDRNFSKRMSSMSTMSAGIISSQATKSVNSTGLPLKIVFPYKAMQDDELTLEPGNDVILIKEFDDGWALGMQPHTGQKGAFPMACVAKSDDVEKRRSERFSKDRLSKRLSSIAW